MPVLRRSAPGSGPGRVLLSADGVRLSARHDPPSDGAAAPDLALVVAHGFTGSWSRAPMRAVAGRLRARAGVVTFDFRGHGRSGGLSTVGDLEVLDVDAAVRWARLLGYERVVAVGFSMGASCVVRHAGLRGPGVHGHALAPVDGVVAVSGPARWRYQGTDAMRRVHVAIESPAGRWVTRTLFGTRIAASGWDPEPEAPRDVAARIAPAPLLVVHGDADHYFPVEHALELHAAAAEPKELWVERGYGHAEVDAPAELLDRVAAWADDRTRSATVAS